MKKEKYIYERATKKGSKYFQIQISFKDNLGQKKTFHESVLFSDYGSRSLALKASIKIRDEALYKIQSQTIVIETPLVKDLFEKKFDLMPRSLKTISLHRLAYKHGISKLGNRQIGTISTAELQENINQYSDGRSSDQISKYRSIWSDLYTVALMLGYNIPDRTRMVILPKSKKITPKKAVTTTVNDFQIILDALLIPSKKPARTHLKRMIWYMLQIGYYTGMRPAEILALNADDITADGISVSKSIGSSSSESIAIVPTKTKQSIRIVPIHPDLAPILKQLLSESHTSPLLTTFSGDLFNSATYSLIINQISEQTGIKFNAYMLRHNMATDLIKQGTNPRTVQDILGHANFSMSMEYARSSKEDREKAVDKRKLS